MRITNLIALTFVAVALVVPAVAKQATPIKKPKVLGERITTVTTYEAGSHINCQAKCSPNAGYEYWQCKGTHSDVRCFVDCRAPAPHGQCVPY